MTAKYCWKHFAAAAALGFFILQADGGQRPAAEEGVPAALFDARFDNPEKSVTGWNFCQVNPGKIGFGQKREVPPAGDAVVRKFLINKIDRDSHDTFCDGWVPSQCVLGGARNGVTAAGSAEEAGRGEERDPEPMGPSFVTGESPPSQPYPVRADADRDGSPLSQPPNLDVCPSAEKGFNFDDCAITPIIQRNEMRLGSKNSAIHPVAIPHWYRIDFRMDGVIPSCGSVRWVIGQWKYRKPNLEKGVHQSPFLAQRFDNGVFHITTQSNQCRCLIAKAEGDFQKVSIADPFRLGARSLTLGAYDADETTLLELPDEKLVCLKPGATGEPGATDEPPESCRPANFEILTEKGKEIPFLPDPKVGWVRMMYKVSGGPSPDGQIDIYANDEFVARVKGLLGYETKADDTTPLEKRTMKFKIGQYRDKIPYDAALLLERVCIARDARSCLSPEERRRFKPIDGRWD